jgi:hypothetical protein
MGLGLGNINTQAKISHFTSAMNFDGSADFLQASDDDATTFGDGETDLDFSIILWFKIDDSSADRPLLLKLNEYYIWVNRSTIYVRLYDNDTSNYRQWYTSSGGISADKWFCAIFVFNGDGSGPILAGEATLYLNGITKTTANSGLTSSDQGTYEGMHNKGNHRTGSDGSNLLDGSVACIAIIGAAIGTAAAARIYNNGVPTNLKERHGISSAILKAYWTYGNASGDTISAVQDLSATGINMTQTDAAKKPVLVTGANVRTGVN